uniref:Uncharacterized protein n=1 Tax=Paenarthrobacter aurescens TaxID=43663 RepID=Q6SKF1_PAEAU|nr:hypothetical protein [Paenarthrobacter aurescens]
MRNRSAATSDIRLGPPTRSAIGWSRATLYRAMEATGQTRSEPKAMQKPRDTHRAGRVSCPHIWRNRRRVLTWAQL